MVPVILLSAPWRLVLATLVATSLATLPTYALALVLLPPVPLVVIVRSFALGTALPALLAWTIGRVLRGTAAIEADVLRLRRGDLDVAVPCAAIAGLRPWWIPLPCMGLAVVLRSGRRLGLRLATRDPSALLDGLAAGGVAVGAARHHPGVIHAATRRSRRWWGAIVKFPVLGTLPAGVLFYTHQHIAYGGTFGQYYLEGPAPYLRTFAEYWATTVILLLSYAGAWRAAAEASVWSTAALAPSWAGRARRVAEAACAAAYYLGVPALLALRYSS